MDVTDWLRGLGLDEYETAFRDHQIEADELPVLTDRQLKAVGVSLGHRLRMLRAIRQLAELAPRAALDRGAQAGAERRQLTVMFCDLVGLMSLTARLDSEDAAELIRSSQGAIAAAAARFEGHVARWVGDGATIYFGYPRAHEDDAERAARAALALVETVAKLRSERAVALEARVGISTGLVVVGELIGEGEALERGVVGDTPNLAARLRDLAEPGTVLISEPTRRLLGNAFEVKALVPQTIKGFSSEVQAWQIVREQENVSRFEASRSKVLTPFIGREEEMALLLDRWQRALRGEGQVVMLSGEAGIGKSRLVAMLHERIGQQYPTVLRYQCSPYNVYDAFSPVIGQVRRGAGFVSGEPPEARIAKLEGVIERAGLDVREIMPYLASALAIPAAQQYPLPEMAPAELKERTITVMVALMVALAKQAPLLILLEDAHWIDPTTLDLTRRTSEQTKLLPVLMVMTFRPGFVAPWAGRPHVTSVSLDRFGRKQALAMIHSMTSGKGLPAEVVDQIVAKTDGVPLFVEELTKSVQESGLLREENGAYVLTSALTPIAIPSTLQDSLMARLDRLSAIKEIAQIGAVIGREFSHKLLACVAPLDEAALDDALRQLMQAELIYRRGEPPTASYVFKHALVQDAAYGSLLRSRRQRIHADIAQALELHLTEDEYPPATLAYHYTEAGLAASAAPAWLAAAEQALSQSAPVEAERHASAGLALVPRIAAGDRRDALELALLVARANALVPLKSISAPETFAALNEAKRLLDQGVGTDFQRVSVLFGLCAATTLRARMQAAIELAHQITEVAERQDDSTYRLVAYRMLAANQYYAGQHREALASLRRGNEYRDPRKQRAISYRFGWDPSLAILCFEVLVRLSLGLLDSAAEICEQVHRELASHAHATTVASAKFCAGTWPQAILADLAGLERDSSALVAYCAEKRVEQIRLLASLHHAYARAMREPSASNIAAQRGALDDVRAVGGFTGTSFFLCNLAETGLAGGDLQRTETALQDGFTFVEHSGERFWLADLHRLSGQLELRRKPLDTSRAESCLLKAIDVAKSQNARLLELRAATDLAELWQVSSSGNDSRALLRPILASIEGGETAPDVLRARKLLTELA